MSRPVYPADGRYEADPRSQDGLSPAEAWGQPDHAPGVPEPGRRRRGTVVLLAVLAVFLGALAWVAFTLFGGGGDDRAEATAAATFLTAWQAGDHAGMQAVVEDPTDDMRYVYGGLAERLHVTGVRVRPGELDATGTRLPFEVTLTLEAGTVRYAGAVDLVETRSGWRVRFTARTVHPSLGRGQRLDLVEGASSRAVPLDRRGTPLTEDTDLKVNIVGSVDGEGEGTSGLQRVLDDRLQGTSGTSAAVVDAATGAVVERIASFSGRKPAGVRTTFDLRIQEAAGEALAGIEGAAALAVVDVRTGEVRALAGRPVSGTSPAFARQYPPGSTFKIVTAAALLQAGSGTGTTVDCPESIAIEGRRFHNYSGAPSGRMSLTRAFSVSCNTAFIGEADRLPDGALVRTARAFGFDGTQPLPIASIGGDIAEPSSRAGSALDAIGQGTVTVSPLHMASVAAAVAGGTWHQPHVLRGARHASHPVPGAPALRAMMRSAVTSGTGSAVSRVPGGPVSGKTGSAEYEGESPDATHAWFVGWQRDLAFAVLVEGGGSGGETAAPIAADFLRLLADRS